MARWLARPKAGNGFGTLLCCMLAAACSSASPVSASQAPVGLAEARAAPPAVPAAALTAPAARDAASLFTVAGVLRPDRPLELGDYLWDEDGVPPGQKAIVVDLKAQILYVYRGGIEIGRSAILYGSPDKPTPTGTFRILEKDADHVSSIYGAPMPYMLRLTLDGIAIHGSKVEYGYATHGCVGVPDEFAALLFAEVRLGAPVLITNGWRTDVYGA